MMRISFLINCGSNSLRLLFNMNNKKTLSITVGIPTCYSGNSLVRTVESIRNADLGKSVRILVTADRNPMSNSILKELKKLKAEITWNSVEGSQFKKIKQMVQKTKSDIYISTQDDVTFDNNTIKEIINAFYDDPSLTMTGIRFLPLKSITFFESAMVAMHKIVDTIAGKWNNGNNIFSASGRCLAFRTKHIKKFRIPQAIVNGDTFFYFENGNLGGTFKRLDKAIVYIRFPQKIQDQIGPSSRYQHSYQELQDYFDRNIKNEYKIPLPITLRAFIAEFTQNPIPCAYYLIIRIYTRIVKLSKKEVTNTIWQVDSSTKST